MRMCPEMPSCFFTLVGVWVSLAVSLRFVSFKKNLSRSSQSGFVRLSGHNLLNREDSDLIGCLFYTHFLVAASK